MNRSILFGVLVAAVTAVALAGCGTAAMPAAAPAPQAAPAAAAEHNDADTTFATSMVPHHTQAIEMAQLATDHATSSKVKELAGQIEQAQGPEITQLQGLLAAWGEKPAPTSMGDMGGMGGMPMDGKAAMPGMMSDQQMKQLQAASGAAFDRMWLQMMIEHHTGAIEMARTELSSGTNAEAKDLAQNVVDAQQSEITTMKQLLTSL
jgi:uncharacterized protein (DUF305 family)